MVYYSYHLYLEPCDTWTAIEPRVCLCARWMMIQCQMQCGLNYVEVQTHRSIV